MSTITTRAGKGSPLTNNEVDANFTNLNTDKAELSGAAFTGAITTTSTVDGRDVATDGSKLDGIEASADVTDTTNVTAAGALMDSEVTNLAQVKAFDSTDYATAAQGTTADAALPRTGGAMTGAITTNSTFDGRDVATDGTKLDGIEASADVTDTANVTAAGALMDSELTSEASVKALNQGVATTDSPTFAALTSTGEITANGGIALGDNDKATFGANDDLQIYSDGTHSRIYESGSGLLIIRASNFNVNNADGSDSYIAMSDGGAVTAFYDGSAKLATTSTGIDVTGVITTDGMTTSADINFGDNDKAVFGAGSDLQIYHDGSNSIVADVGTGHLKLLGNDLRINNADSSKSYFSATNGGSAILYYDAAAKLATTSTGIDVTGTATMDVLDASGTGVHDLQRSHPTTTASLAVLDLKAKSTGDMAAGFGTAARFIIEDTANVENVVAEIAARRESSDLTAALTFTTLVKERMRIASNGDISFYEDTGTTPKFFWDASAESLGIGTSSPAFVLDVAHASDNGLARFTSGDADAYITIGDVNSTSAHNKIGVITHDMYFNTNGSERMRIDSSGNLLVGTTSTAVSSSTGSVTGSVVNSSGLFEAAKTGTVMELNRLSADGTILNFRKDGTAVGSIGTVDGFPYISSNSNVGLKFLSSRIRPVNSDGSDRDDAIDLGASSARFDDIYATNGTIQTSDRNEKQDIEVLSEAEQRVAVAAKGLLRKFRWKDSVAEKGDDARIHFGIIAQDLQDAFAAEGLDAGDYAMFISTTWTDEETNEEKTRMGVRYSELLAFIIAAI